MTWACTRTVHMKGLTCPYLPVVMWNCIRRLSKRVCTVPTTFSHGHGTNAPTQQRTERHSEEVGGKNIIWTMTFCPLWMSPRFFAQFRGIFWQFLWGLPILVVCQILQDRFSAGCESVGCTWLGTCVCACVCLTVCLSVCVSVSGCLFVSAYVGRVCRHVWSLLSFIFNALTCNMFSC